MRILRKHTAKMLRKVASHLDRKLSKRETTKRRRVFRSLLALGAGIGTGMLLHHEMAKIIADGMIAAAFDILLLGGEV